MTEETVERKHHPYSPSTLQNLEWCPHYRGKQQETPHVRTVAGTKAHGVVETGEDDLGLGDDDAAAAAECLDFIEQRRRLMELEAHDAWIRTADRCSHVDNEPDEAEFQVEELKETYLPIDGLKFPDAESTTAGYVDRVLVARRLKRAEMFDWKFGFWPVEDAADNLQGISYTLGLFRRFPELDTIRFFFKQPHLGMVSDAVFTRDQIPALYLRIQTVVARARVARQRDDFSMAKPAVPICQFCSELGRCTPVCNFACKVGVKFHPIEIPADITPTMLQSPAQTSLGLKLAAVLAVWCKAFRSQVTDRILRGEAELPADQKIQEMSKRELISMELLKPVALRYLTQAEYDSTLDCTFGALETLIKEKAPRGQKEGTVKEFQAALIQAGAVKMGDSFSFLRAIPVKK